MSKLSTLEEIDRNSFKNFIEEANWHEYYFKIGEERNVENSISAMEYWIHRSIVYKQKVIIKKYCE